MSLVALLDGDIYCCRVGYSCESKEGDTKIVTAPEIAYSRLQDMIENTLRELGTTEYKIFLTDSAGNFRKKVSHEYKANRKPGDKPVLLPQLEAFLQQEYGAIRATGEEADDLLGIHQTAHRLLDEDSVICSIDKDLLQIEGKHYNFVKCELQEISEDQGNYNLYKQLLMGDSTDNIAGVPGIGAKKADKFLLPFYGDSSELMREVWKHYEIAYPQLAEEELEELVITIGRLVYIRRKPGELWQIPT